MALNTGKLAHTIKKKLDTVQTEDKQNDLTQFLS